MFDVARWLAEQGLEQYAEAFAENAIDDEILRTLSGDDLKELGVQALGHRKKLLAAIALLSEERRITRARESRERAIERSGVAERRQLTVLFCDLVGSTELSARLDPEDLRTVMRAYQDACADVVTRFHGHVARYLGDGVLAYFGWPRAHEDDAERAVRAGLELTQVVAELKPAADLKLEARVGIATGLVVIGDLLGEGAAQEEAVVGETPNLAARLQALAEPGATVIAPATRRLLGDLFELRDLGDHHLKGFADPMPAWCVLGEGRAESRFEALRGSYRTPLVDRERELAILEAARREAANGHGQMVSAVGEPGVGKSRLFNEFLSANAFGTWRVRRCNCLSYGANTPWLPVVNLVKGYFGIQDRDEHEQATRRVTAGLAPLGAAMMPAAIPICALLNLPIDNAAWQALNPPQRRRRILDAVKGLLLLETERQPLVLVVEDLHWADEETLALLDGLIESLSSQHMLILVTYRPEFEHRWGGRTCYYQLRIDPLGAEGGGRLLLALLGSDPSVADLKPALVERTGGNPLFLEEAVRDLAETGVLQGQLGAYCLAGELGRLRLPPTVQAIIATRIDRLSPEARRLLQRAAVIGHDIPRALLESVADLYGEGLDRRLRELQVAEILQENPLLPEVEYTFKHALIHDVAYAGLLREARRKLHTRVGEAIEELYPHRLTELAEALTDHFEEGEVWAKVARYALDAAKKAKSRYAYQVGMRFAERSRDAAAKHAQLDQEWILANIQLGDLASLVDDLELANQSYGQALTKSKDPTERLWIANKRHELHFTTRDDAKIAYYTHRSGGETILFASVIGYGLAVWQPVVERLCQEYRIITIDARGTGRSDPITRPYFNEYHGLDVVAVTRAAAADPIIAVGISRGGMMVAHAAAVAPELFKRLVVVDAMAGPAEPGTQLQKLVAAEAQAARDGEVERAVRMFLGTVVTEPGTEDLLEQRVQSYLRLPMETILSFYDPRPPADSEIIPLLRKVGLPLLVMHGTEDKRLPFEHGCKIVEGVPGAQLYPFEGRCHLCQVTATQEFCDVLREFVRTGRASRLAVHPAGFDSIKSISCSRSP